MEKQISAAFHHEAALREALSNLLSDALSTELEKRANDIEKLQAFCADEYMPDAVDAKGESAAPELPVQAPLEKDMLEEQDAVMRFFSGAASPRTKVTLKRNDSWHVPDVVGTNWEFLASEVSELQALLKKEVLEDFSADLKFRESLSRENLAFLSKPGGLMVGDPLIASTTASKSSDGTTSPDDGSTTTELASFAKPKALVVGHPLIVSTTASKSSDGSTSPDDGSSSPEVAPLPKPKSFFVARPLILRPKASKASDGHTSLDDQSTSPYDRSTRSPPYYSTRTAMSVPTPRTGSCKFFVERIKDM
jgi:hypothetical protein